MKTDYSQLLNEQQYRAVTTTRGPLFILAGAGSGKTRVITYRICYMLESGINQSSILAVTFTNKAAREMRQRIKQMSTLKLSNLNICTFHAFGLQILKKHAHELGYRPNFIIYDQTDKQSLIKEIAQDLRLNQQNTDFCYLANLFSAIKTEHSGWDSFSEQYLPLFNEYQRSLKLFNALDFDDLIILPLQLFNTKERILKKYQKKYEYTMVDEFQDTSALQYKMIESISRQSRNICIVGDDDQSIYSWRGANYQNLVSFEKDFPETREIKLERNYRSSDIILAAANSLISNNQNRKSKKLWTIIKKGEAITVCINENEKQEAQFIASECRAQVFKNRINYNDIAILVRTNHLTRSIEEALLRDNILYTVSGGISFFSRKEVKDIIAYLKLLANSDDDTSLLRIVNLPHRGIGKNALTQLIKIAHEHNCSIYSAMTFAVKATDSPLNKKTLTHISNFIHLCEYYQQKIFSENNMASVLSSLIDKIQYRDYLKLQHKNQNTARFKYMNVENVINSLAEYESDPDNLDPTLYDYLNRITLVTMEDTKQDENQNKLNLMTIHAAKGLEFRVVFIAALEENIIPHNRSLANNENNIEEERRLFYVAITRAKDKLYLSFCKNRRQRGIEAQALPSPFLDELPEQLLQPYQPDSIVDKKQSLEYISEMKKIWN